MERERFERLVARAVADLPEEFQSRMENIDVVVEDFPARSQMRRLRRGDVLLGLYEGVPITQRNSQYGLVPPDKISIFQKPIESICGENDDRIAREIQRVVRHEIAHHFGIDDARLAELEKEE